MRYPIVLALLWWQRLAVGLPGADRAAVADVLTTCRNPVSPFDYSAKVRREYELPLCRDGDDSHPVLGAMDAPSLLAGRATVDDYTCAPDRPCANSACCPKASLQCNYGEEACGTSGISPNEVCWFNCDAKSECGINAKVPGQKCPLNVCCGKWGFCGMTEDYCDAEDHGATGGCQSNCDQPGPKDKADSQDRVIGYYEAWRADSACQGMGLNDIPVSSLTHLYFSFASITPDTYSIAPMDGIPGSLLSNFTNLKRKNPALKTVIAIGGWTFNDPGPTQKVFSNMVSSARTRETFIDNLFSFLREYAFDGVDFDWEYPGADDRGGIDTDGANFVTFLKELNDANKKQPVKYVVSFTAPTSYWYLRHFDLKAVDHVDFVNVMSYDLHGVWDGKNPIGQHIYGHTNLTEMKQAFDLFWRNDVPANKLNMGLGFYGRAFQLQDPSCSTPGCGFKGGATKGGCSGESGILSYREIMAVIDAKKIKPVHEKKAGVNYITWNSDQWVSYDDADTFSQKKDLAKDLGLGGFLIWAIDQDDEHLSALQAVLSPKKLGDLGAAGDKDDWQSSNKHCYITSCDGNCDAGDIKITDQPCGDDDKRSKLCCPLSGAPDPKECTWRGGESGRWCNGHCHDDEVMMEMNKWGNGDGCWDGNKAYCCKSPLAEENSCYWGGVGASCNGDDLPLTFSGTVLTILEDVAKVILRVVGRAYPLAALTGEVLLEVLDALDLDTDKYYCCPKEDIPKWKNCDWFGKPGNCFDGHCPDMTYAQLTDSYFGGGETCGGQLSRVRTFCCESSEDPLFLPVPLGNLFEHPPEGNSVDTDFNLETDKDSDSQQNPNDAAFQFVVLASPEELQVSIDKRDGSHWDVFSGCDSAVGEEGPHTVQMVCTDFSEDSNCHKIGLGHGVPGTILQMPVGCGPGKYAVAKDMAPTSDQKKVILPRHLKHLSARSTPIVYDLTFDYDFTRVPRDLGDTQMRVDFSNQDDYWDTVVSGAANSKKKVKRSLADTGGNHVRWLEEEFRDDYHFGALSRRDLEERWFGSDVLDWLARLVRPEIKREFTYNYEDTLTAKLIDETWQCNRDGVGYEGHLLAQALLKVNIQTSFGFTLIVTKLSLPLDLSQSYLTFYNKGEITGVLTLEAVAKFSYHKGEVIVNIPFPGASFTIPGIAVIGPQLTVEGSIDASLTLAGKVETRLEFANWEVRQVVPDNGDSNYTPKEIGDGDPDLKRNGDDEDLDQPSFYAGVQAVGDVTAKISAAAEFGVRFDKRWEVDPAAAAVVGEASVMIKMGAGVSTKDTCPFTWGLNVGARLFARAKAPAFKWPGVEVPITPTYNKPIFEGGTCPELGPLPNKRDLNHLAIDGNYSLLSVPVGSYFCPPESDDSAGPGTVCSKIGYAWDSDDGDSNAIVETRALPFGHVLEKRAPKTTTICSRTISFPYPTDGEAKNLGNPTYGFRTTDCDDYEFGAPLDADTANSKYEAEHVLEFQLTKQFFDDLDLNLDTFPHPDPSKTTRVGFCQLVTLLWNIQPVAIPNLDTASGNGAALTPYNHIASQFPTKTWKQDEYVRLDTTINSPPKASAWAGLSTTYKQIQIVDFKKWIGGDPNDPNSPVNQDDPNYSGYITDIGGAEKIMKSMRAIVGSRLYHNDALVMSILRDQKGRVGEVLRRLDTEILPANPKQAGWTAWVPLGLKERWDEFMKGKMALAVTKSNKVLNDILPRMQAQWADQAAREAARPNDNDSQTEAELRARKQRLIDSIDALADILRVLPAWQWAF
ncbi:glycosyl hydrolases family 18-domain-containing protein [Pseudomassariella vexata]|uniref:chitinase n=1 Tax=Pseudomassariella vexata TaxID=1141098 RepID=A0A1Y2EBI1_9PEZI|nr:glycosyl hydrolases family 18-domain-containing protein [Pseudomassariella vexata]ORY68195.1 glycosyl hydrolases family 18-domain-containing protein [Pseudomassariella vexata]